MSNSPKTKEPSGIQFSPAVLAFTQQVETVEMVSSTTLSLLRELTQGNLSSKQLAARITQDPTLSASLLRLANSAYYGIPNRVSTVGHAVSLLGFVAVRNLIQGICLAEFESSTARSKEATGSRKFSAHSMAVSKMAGILTRKFGFPALGQGEAETAGLLHDIGFLLMAAAKDDLFQTLVSACQTPRAEPGEDPTYGRRLLDLERNAFGFTHPELGAWLAEKWNLPDLIQEALLRHHSDLSDCLNRESVTVVQLANLLCNENEMEYLPEGFWGDVDPSVLRFLESQNKLEIYQSLPQSIEADIERVKEFHATVLSGIHSESRRAPEPESEPRRQVRSESEGDSTGADPGFDWGGLLPGLTHFQSGRREAGLVLMSFFTVSVGVGIAAVMGGHAVLGAGALVAVGVSWGISLLWE